MRVLVTGSAGHLGEALARRLPELGWEVVGLDRRPGGFVDVVGSIADADVLRTCLDGVDAVVHAAALHKPHVVGRSKAAFIETNVVGTQRLLDAVLAAGVSRVVLTSTTSAFGHALRGTADRAAWVDESVVPRPKNIYGVTKCAAEDLGELAHAEHGLPVVVLRTSRFFPEQDDVPSRAAAFGDANLKVNELLHRRIDLDDVVTAHAAALDRAPQLGFRRLIVSATTPFLREDAAELVANAEAVIARRCSPQTRAVFDELGWRLPRTLDRVYDNAAARAALGWAPALTFDAAVRVAADGGDPFSALTRAVGEKGYGDGG